MRSIPRFRHTGPTLRKKDTGFFLDLDPKSACAFNGERTKGTLLEAFFNVGELHLVRAAFSAMPPLRRMGVPLPALIGKNILSKSHDPPVCSPFNRGQGNWLALICFDTLSRNKVARKVSVKRNNDGGIS
jgi:hypothetical protein